MVLHVFGLFHRFFLWRFLDDQLHLVFRLVFLFGNGILRLGFVGRYHFRMLRVFWFRVVLGLKEDVILRGLLPVVVRVYDFKRRVFGERGDGRQTVFFFLVVNEIGVDVLAVVGHVFLLSF